ncbi:MAG TPA: O-antigen ligase family protein [Bacteroidales bacterium]|nr:O-antigen ligase family protein [Bacteroidales bacterium]HPS61418.1 O-antigen ligase family protein [Bacteroidales bacterium]
MNASLSLRPFPFTWKQFERYWYIFSLCIIIIALPYSKVGLSIGQMMMAGGWIVERFDYKRWVEKMRGWTIPQRMLQLFPLSFGLLFRGIFGGFREFGRRRAAILFSSILLMHVLGLIFTTDFGYAFKDLRTKLPLFLLPLFLSTSKAFDRTAFYRFLALFVLAVTVRSVFNAWMIATHTYPDIREVSHNISHIIFSLQLSISLYILLFFLLKRGILALWQRIALLPVLLWLVAYILLSHSFTGLAISVLTLLILVPILIFRTRKHWLKVALSAMILIIGSWVFFTIRSVVKEYYHVNPVDLSHLEKFTSRGNPYIHNPYSNQTENGNYVWIYVNWDEMRAAWNARSRMPFDSVGKKKETVAFTVVRYLSSKGWRKDADAVERLSPKEVTAIENGVANCIFLEKFSIRGRLYEFIWGFDQYRKTGDPTGSTTMQRVEFWKASLGIIRDYWLTGVGTGDMNLAFAAQYEKMHTQLPPEQRWRSHNQFLSILVGFGVLGFAWFLLAFFYPPAILGRYDDWFFLVFMIISVLSMLTGDTIESQTGVSFVAFFYSLLLFARREKDPLNIVSPISLPDGNR